MIFSLFYAYFYFSDYVTEWYNLQNTPNLLWEKFFDFSQYGVAFYASILMVTLVPTVIIGIPWFRSVNSIAFSSLLVVIGLWIRRYLMIVPVLETPYLPVQQDIRQDWVLYHATWIEWTITAAGVALFILFFVIASRIAPIIPCSEMVEKEGESRFVFSYKKKKHLSPHDLSTKEI
ncbi:MAG TPA: hypothetical protein DCX54_01610 [Flavobacteriales bacterium]|nr:hypothetical protein [Flavobacteriales bacterium]